MRFHLVLPVFAIAAGLALAASGQAADAPSGMVLVPGGAFRMGTDQGAPYEAPEHSVEVPAFYLDRQEVTVAEYARFVTETARTPPPDWAGGKPDPKRLNHPVVNVSWYDANAYARWAGKRLPTEAEWEKAARGTDGRRFPWGAEWDEKRASVEGSKGEVPLRTVGSYPEGASPYGALDLCGNAWEWTSDWFQAYPGNPVPSVHFGEKYRTVRGLGSVYFYNSPPVTEKHMAARARVQPFGRYDSLGFRCAMDAGETRRIAPEVKAPREREKPVPPKTESPAEVAARYRDGIPVTVETEDLVMAREGVATVGVPFPEGVLRDTASLRSGGPLQARPLARWRDGSVRWALLDLPAKAGPGAPQQLRLRWNGEGAVPAPKAVLKLVEDGEGVRIDTGGTQVVIRKDQPRWLEIGGGERWIAGPEERAMAVEGKVVADKAEAVTPEKPVPLRMQPPSKITVEDRGPLRARVRVEGWLVDGEEKPVIRYRARVDALAGASSVKLVHTFTHLSPRRMLMLRGYDLHFRVRELAPAPLEDAVFSLNGFSAPVGTRGPSRLEQLSADQFTLRRGDNSQVTGTRAGGVVLTRVRDGFLLAVREFWQQFPKALSREEDGLSVSLWTGPEPFDTDQGLAKTHELRVGLTGASGGAELVASLPADWYCATRGLGVLAPYSLSKYPQFETEMEAAADLEARSRPYGMRNWGDNYFGGPYKGFNSYQNVEYDVPYNHFMQFARTGARKYLEAGLIQARHQGDIDFKHDGGPQWKHSPRHTTTEAELGHVFLRGLVASTWLTGDPEGLENARLLGDWLIKVVGNPRNQGNERQIGWGLYALSGIYEATWDPRYLEVMKACVDRLLAGQDALGRFDIRYDNRIAFFYGVTLSGFVKYYEATGDERILESVRKIVTRIQGFYPEYAGRTLEGLAWLYARTGDPEVRLTAQRTWESTMVWKPFDLGGMSIFTTRFLPSVETLGLACPREWQIPETGPVEDGSRRQHYRAPSGVLFLQSEDRQPIDLVLLRHVGLSPATVRVTDAKGRPVLIRNLQATGEPLQYAKLALPAGGPFRIALKSESTRAWDLLTARRTKRVFHMPDWKHMEALTPRAYFQLEPGAKEVRLQLDAVKEGFKGAVLKSSGGDVAGALSRFIDFGDEKPYVYDLTAPVGPELPPPPGWKRHGLWSLDLQNVSVRSAAGIRPYVATSPDAFMEVGPVAR